MEALEQLKRNFNEWRLCLSQIVEKHEQKYNPPDRDDGDDGDGDPDDTPRRRTRERARDRDRDKPNNNFKDAVALKPEMLETSMSSLQINTWFDDFMNYRFASGWSQGLQHVQKGYLKNIISDEIRIAVDFRNQRTVD